MKISPITSQQFKPNFTKRTSNPVRNLDKDTLHLLNHNKDSMLQEANKEHKKAIKSQENSKEIVKKAD